MALALKQSVAMRPNLGNSRRSVVCAASKPEPEAPKRLGLGTVVAVTLIAEATFPQEAMAAGSGGRAGGSRFSSARTSGGYGSARTAGGYGSYNAQPRVTNTTVVVGAPSYSPFGFGGFGFGMPVYRPMFGFGFGFGFLIQLLCITAVVGFVATMVKGFMNGSNKNNKQNGDGWGDL